MDIRSLGNAVIETIEPETFSLDPNTLVLRNRGNLDVRAFLSATKNESLEDLKKVTFPKPHWVFPLTKAKQAPVFMPNRPR
jgi:hypothetical protein